MRNRETSAFFSSYGRRNNQQEYRILLLSCLLVTLCISAVYLFNPRFVQFLSYKVTDTVQTLVSPPGSAVEPEVVAIDEQSLEKYGQWPWPRYLIAQLLNEIKKSGARAVGVGILFPERDRTSPASWLEGATEKFGLTLDVSQSPFALLDFDRYLADVLATGPFVMGYSFKFHATDRWKGQCNLTPNFPLAEISPASLLSNFLFHRANSVVCNYFPLENAVKFTGFLNAAADKDGTLRRLPLLIEFEGALYPSFALATLMQFYSASTLVIEADEIAQAATFTIAQHRIPISRHGNYLLNPYTQKKRQYISAADVLDKKVARDFFTNKLVLAGTSASGLNQDFTTPFTTKLSTLDLHRNSVETLAAHIYTVRPHYFNVLETAAAFLLCLILFTVIVNFSSFSAGVFGLLGVGLSWIAALVMYKYSGYLYSPLLPSSSILLNYFVLTTLKFSYSSQLANSEKGSALNKLQTSEDNLQSILKSIPDIFFRLDQDGRFTFISPAISRYCEASESLLENSIFDFVAPEDLEKARYKLNERRTGDRATLDFEIKMLLTRKIGEYRESKRYFSVSATGIYASVPGSETKKFVGTQGIIRDINDRKRLENQLLQAQKMEVVGNLAAGIAHDLNNILSGLVSYPDLLLLEIPEDDPMHKKISVIQRSGKKAAVIVQDLLTLARRNIKTSDLCNLNTILTDYLDSAEFHLLQSKYPKIRVNKDLAKDLLHVKGSAVHLSKMIMNVLHNAIEAMPAGGDIAITTKNKYVDVPLVRYEKIPDGKYVSISIADTGIGISKEDLSRIFEPFYTKKPMRSSGTGIGMTVIWATIKDHQGYIDIASREGEGTTVTIYLPTTELTSEYMEHRVVLEDFVGSESILIVDDISEQRIIGANMLKKLGYNVLTASSGEEAIRILQGKSVDLLILDMIMPGGLDGLATYEAIITFVPGQKAIITSGFSESQRVDDLLRLGAGAYVQKPFTLEEIGVAVRSELDKQ